MINVLLRRIYEYLHQIIKEYSINFKNIFIENEITYKLVVTLHYIHKIMIFEIVYKLKVES